MSAVTRFMLKVTGPVRRNAGLTAWFWVLVAAQPLVPVGHPLARADLLPWLLLALTGAALLRGKSVGEGPHPMLEAQTSRTDRLLRAGGRLLLPWVLLFSYDAARLPSAADGAVALLGAGLVLLLLRMSRHYRRTAWNPGRRSDGPAALASVALFVAGAAAVGAVQGFLPETLTTRWIGPSVVLGLSFLATSTASGEYRGLRQRLRAGRRDGKAYRPSLFRPVLTATGPAIGLGLLLILVSLVGGSPADFGSAFAASLHVVAWAGVLWARETPVAVSCLLHEVVPSGGKDETSEESAIPFDRPPEGALRLHPLHIKRTRGLHPWLVPVRAARIGDYDDPVRPLWTDPPAALPAHVLGAAGFELDRDGRPQWERLTIQLRGRDDLTGLSDNDAQTRRIYVLRAFPPPGGSRRPSGRSYAWDRSVPESTLTIVDASTESIELTDGSILVLSTEGVARAYQLEIGAPLYGREPAPGSRPPQIEDYTSP